MTAQSEDAAGEPQAELWPLWQGLRKLFPAWSTPLGWWDRPANWFWWGNDLVSNLRTSRPTQRAFALLEAADAGMLEKLAGVAAVNERRHEHFFRFAALVYLTLPLSAAAMTVEAAPDALQRVYDDSPEMVWFTVLGFGVTVLFSLAGLWRARQMVAVLDLIGIERGLGRLTERD
jgi:hypothetical protein